MELELFKVMVTENNSINIKFNKNLFKSEIISDKDLDQIIQKDEAALINITNNLMDLLRNKWGYRINDYLQEITKLKIDKTRKELHKLIDEYGIQNSRVVSKSQELDLLIISQMRDKL